MSALASSPESPIKEITDSNTKANRISSNTGEQKEDHCDGWQCFSHAALFR